MPISLVDHSVLFYFPQVHADAVLSVDFQSTLRVPDDGTTYGLPPCLGRLPVRRVADLADRRLSQRWMASGGVVMPMWQSQACWLNFSADYPFLVKVGAGSINAITGKSWSAAPDFEEEDYIEVPNQPWLDGFCVERGKVRQFVAMPLHAGYTVEEQVSPGEAVGGLRFVVIPLKAAIYEQRKADGLRAGSPETLMGRSLLPVPAWVWVPAGKSGSRSRRLLKARRIGSCRPARRSGSTSPTVLSGSRSPVNDRRYCPRVPRTTPRTDYRGLTGTTTHSPGPGRTSWLA